MSLDVCIPDLVKEGKLTQEQADDARAIYDEHLREYVKSGSPAAAEALASKAAIEAMEHNITRKEFKAGLDLTIRNTAMKDMRRYDAERGIGGRKPPAGGGPIDPRAGPAFIMKDPRSPASPLELRRKSIRGRANAMMDKFLVESSSNALGIVRNKALMHNLALEAFGKDTGDAMAKEIIGAWRATAEYLRRRFNKAGGAIGFRADWGLPQLHNWETIRKAGYETWRKYFRDRLDPSKMIDERTGLSITEANLEKAMHKSFLDIRSRGAASRELGSASGAKSLAEQRAESRFYVFKDGEAWEQYAEKYGRGGAYDAMISHMDGMSRDIAAMEIFGTNPPATIKWIQRVIMDSAEADVSPGSKGVDRATTQNAKLSELWDEYNGSHVEPGNVTFSKFGSAWRGTQTYRKLGFSLLSTPTDFATQAVRRHFNGVAVKTMFPQWFASFRPFSKADQQMAARRGLISDQWIGRAHAQARDVAEELMGELPRRASHFTLRMSLLLRHTPSAQKAMGQEMLARYTEAADKSYGELNKGMRRTLERYGMDADAWDKIRSAPKEEDGGTTWIAPGKIEDREAANRFEEMIHGEINRAVTEDDLGVRAMVNARLAKGTPFGELGRSAVQFKSFGITLLMRTAQEIMAMDRPTAFQYAVNFAVATTLAGAVSVQMRQIAAGKDPLPMNTLSFWGQAAVQGGGLSLAGDILQAAFKGSKTAILEYFTGPSAEDLVDTIKMGKAAAQGKNVGRDAVKMGKSLVPGSGLWYLRTAFDRALSDRLQELVDPNYRASYRRAEQAAREQGTQYYWKPGERGPERAPDLENAVRKGSKK